MPHTDYTVCRREKYLYPLILVRMHVNMRVDALLLHVIGLIWSVVLVTTDDTGDTLSQTDQYSTPLGYWDIQPNPVGHISVNLPRVLPHHLCFV